MKLKRPARSVLQLMHGAPTALGGNVGTNTEVAQIKPTISIALSIS